MTNTLTNSQSSSHDALVCQLPADSRLKVVGMGGTGGFLLEPLALFVRSLNVPARLVVIDGDTFEHRNLQRMRFEQLGNKAEVKAAEVAPLLKGSGVTVVAVPQFVTDENIGDLLRDGDHVFLCVDNHQTRRLVSDHCGGLANVALFSGGNDGVDPPRERGTYGNVQIAVRRQGADLTVPLTRYHPEIRNATGPRPGQPDCGQLAVSTPQILMANLAAASALLNAFFAYTCGQLTYQEVQFDILEARSLPQFPVPPLGIPMPSR